MERARLAERQCQSQVPLSSEQDIYRETSALDSRNNVRVDTSNPIPVPVDQFAGLSPGVKHILY
jgi:hypothetical protein